MCDCESNIFNTISNSMVASIGKSIKYKYLQTTVLDLSTIVSGTSYSADPQPGCTLVGSVLTYIPPERQKEQLVYMFTVDNEQYSVVLYPDLSVDYVNNEFMGVDNTGVFYRINDSTNTITPLLDYFGNPLVIPNILCMTMNKDDNLLYYVLNSNLRQVVAYNFATGLTINFITGLTVDLISISYDNNTLYTIQAADGTPITAYNVTNRTRFGVIIDYPQPFTSIGSTRGAIASYAGVFYFAVRTSPTDIRVVQTLPFGSITAIATSTNIGGTGNIFITPSPNGRLYVFRTLDNRFLSSRLMSSFTVDLVSAVSFVAICMLPFSMI